MPDTQQIAQIFSSVSIQIVVVLISILMFIFVKRGSGKKGRYLTHFATSWGIMGTMYLLSAFAEVSGLYVKAGHKSIIIYKQILEVLDPFLSLINAGFLIIAWYMMRDYRIEQEGGVENPLPTMSKPFISTIFASGASIISLFITLMVNITPRVTIIFNIIDVLISMVAIILIGNELSKIPIIKEPGEGSFFISDKSCLKFKRLTFILYLVWAILQLGHIFSKLIDNNMIISEILKDFFDYPTGGLYTLMAIFKLSCATTAVILIIHSLPSIRWQHTETKILRQKKGVKRIKPFLSRLSDILAKMAK